MKTKLLKKLRRKAFNKVSVYFIANEYGGEWCVRTDYDAQITMDHYWSRIDAEKAAEAAVKNIFLEVVTHYKNLHGRGTRNFYPW